VIRRTEQRIARGELDQGELFSASSTAQRAGLNGRG
jgi:hypothetical protein